MNGFVKLSSIIYELPCAPILLFQVRQAFQFVNDFRMSNEQKSFLIFWVIKKFRAPHFGGKFGGKCSIDLDLELGLELDLRNVFFVDDD